MGDGGLCEVLVDERCELRHGSDAEDLFSILETWEECMTGVPGGGGAAASAFSHNCPVVAGGARPATGNSRRRSSVADEAKGGGAPVQKRQKGMAPSAAVDDDGAMKMPHIAVERNRRKQMNEHLGVLRSLMPCFYVKRVSYLGLLVSNFHTRVSYMPFHVYLAPLVLAIISRRPSKVQCHM